MLLVVTGIGVLVYLQISLNLNSQCSGKMYVCVCVFCLFYTITSVEINSLFGRSTYLQKQLYACDNCINARSAMMHMYSPLLWLISLSSKIYSNNFLSYNFVISPLTVCKIKLWLSSLSVHPSFSLSHWFSRFFFCYAC